MEIMYNDVIAAETTTACGFNLIEVIYWSESTSKFVGWCEVSDYPSNSFPGDPHDFEQ